ncbi:YdcF family protein [Candidatus Accumulibacter aalborgensis]|uniref:YdcF family protein n=1 Tax=Candidatus Accumulibacter aalborgensis TaxID=1860102 RepID=UPI001FDF5D96|nr:YdcF family protein [Candidatus Accumulibacter aalborgensis]
MGRFLVSLGIVLLFASSVPIIVYALARPLEDFPPVDLASARSAQAIVILAGGKRRHAPEYHGETVNRLTLERIRYGALLARRTGLPILVSGGLNAGKTSEAQLMREVLEREFGIKVKWTESASRDTHENAVYSADILKAAGVTRIVLVTHAAHMRRSLAEFSAAGLNCLAAPTGFFSLGAGDDSELGLLPSANAAYAGWYISHEWLGNVALALGLGR